MASSEINVIEHQMDQNMASSVCFNDLDPQSHVSSLYAYLT